MVEKQHMRTREDLLDMLERTVAAIMRAGQMSEKAGTIINAVNSARAILADAKIEELEKRIEQMEAGYVYQRPEKKADEDTEVLGTA